ncbi:hypothetical protein [Williamsia deligens]|uniref:Uncharacterized protein n=1 Tax=Williamsia deligens TaxID=321325 RepID=A0ABW3GF27_9NOCA|nr:hypothetical protein [Williamsia deligens]MCP2196333.1 hypothetical protein [Williamsia deligens]
MTDLDREYAILLPNGELLTNHTGCDHGRDEQEMPYSIASIFGPPSKPAPEHVLIWTTPALAQAHADLLRTRARSLGVDNLGVRVVGRICGPWTTPNDGEQLAQALLDYIAGEQR